MQELHLTKTYKQLTDNSSSKMLGCDEVDRLVCDYFEANPELDPIPTLLKYIDVMLYGTGTGVSFE